MYRFRKILLTVSLTLACLTLSVPNATAGLVIGGIIPKSVHDSKRLSQSVLDLGKELGAFFDQFDQMDLTNKRMDRLFGLGEETLENLKGLFSDVGYLSDMTMEYTNLAKRAYKYTTKIKEWGTDGDLSAYTRELRYINRIVDDGMDLIHQYENFFDKFRTTDGEKKDEIDRTRQELKDKSDTLNIMMNNLEKQHFLAQEIQGFSELVNANSSSQDYAQSQARRHAGHYGATSDEDIKAVGSAWGRLINIILGIILGVLVFGAIVIYFRGAGVGDMTSEQVFLRLFVAAVIDTFLLVLYNGVIN